MKQYMRTRRGLLKSAIAASLSLLPIRARGQAAGTVKPGDDFYEFTNAAELKVMKIPPDRWDYGQFDVAGARVQAQIDAIVAQAAARTSPGSVETERVAAVYRALVDEAAIGRNSLPRLKRDLAAIRNARSKGELAALMADPCSSSLVAFNIFPVQGEWMPFLDAQNHSQPALGLPVWNYASKDEDAVAARMAYGRFIAKLLDLSEFDDSARKATEIIALETAIATCQWNYQQIRDRRANLHIMSVAELEAFAPGLPWRVMLEVRGLGDIGRLNLGTDSAVAKLSGLFAATPIESWRTWLAFSRIRNTIDTLPSPFRDADWEFQANGRKIARPTREAEAIRFVIRRMPMEVGWLYAESHVPPGTRERVELMVRYLKNAMSERLRGVDWLDPTARREALAKVDTMRLKAVAPRGLPPWRDPPLRADDALGNLEALTRRDWAVQRLRLTDAEARTEMWYQAPHIVDASYSVLFNAIEIPAAILQPPFFSVDGDPAANFGAIGAILGHEMGHGFDDQGMLFDSKGVLRDWISPASQAEFSRRAESLIAQYGAFEPLPGLHLDGRRTQGENIADLSGVSLALRAYQLYRADHPGATDERSGLRALFEGWARIWCYKAPESAIRHIVTHSYHVPAPYRVNGVVRNIDAWYDAFGVKPGDALYLATSDRVRLW